MGVCQKQGAVEWGDEAMNLNVDPAYPESVKAMRLKARLGPEADCYPIRLWCYMAKRHWDGELRGYREEEVEMLVGWRGDNGALLEAMLEVGFLDRIEGGFRVHDFTEWNAHLEVFHERAKHAANVKWDKIYKKLGKERHASRNASRNPPSVPSVPTPPPDPVEQTQVGGGGYARRLQELTDLIRQNPTIGSLVAFANEVRGFGGNVGTIRKHVKAALDRGETPEAVRATMEATPHGTPIWDVLAPPKGNGQGKPGGFKKFRVKESWPDADKMPGSKEVNLKEI